MGLKFVTCCRHALSGEPLVVHQNKQSRPAKIFQEQGVREPIGFFIHFLRDDGTLEDARYPVRFDQERQGYVDLSDQGHVYSVEEVT